MSFFKRGRRPGQVAALAATAVLAAAGAQLLVSDADAAINGGGITIVNPANGHAMPSGGSQTAFTFDLPASPADRCTGDSASGGYFVYSYITPAANNPNDLMFTSSGPVSPSGSFAYTLVGTTGSPYRARQTDAQTGQVVDFPTFQFNFNKFSANSSPQTANLPAGDYNVGIACWKQSGTPVLDKYWNTVLTFTASSSDPRGEVWGPFVPPQPTTTEAPTTTMAPPTTVAPPPPPPCTPPNGLLSGPVYNLAPALQSLGRSLCGLGL